MSFGQGLLHPCAPGLGGGLPGGGSLIALLPEAAAAAVAGGAPPPVGVWPVAVMTLPVGTTQLVASQGGGGFGDPIERDAALVAADVAAGLVSPAAALADYAVVLAASGAVDPAATEVCRDDRRRARLGGRAPMPAQAGGPGRRRFDDVFDVGDGVVACARCRGTIATLGEPIAPRLLLEERPAAERTPLGYRFTGSERFVVRALHCPHCARQVDVQIARASDPLVDTVEPRPDREGAGPWR